MPLAAAERALLDERRPLTRDEALAVARLPLDELPALIALAHRVRLAWCGPEVELESLINAKSGACAEDCAFCSQSAHFDTGVRLAQSAGFPVEHCEQGPVFADFDRWPRTGGRNSLPPRVLWDI